MGPSCGAKRITPSRFHVPPQPALRVGKGLRRCARDIDRLQLAVRKETDGAAVRRPERERRAIGARERHALEACERSHPESRTSPSWTTRDDMRAVGRDRQTRERSAPASVGRQHLKRHASRLGSRAPRRPQRQRCRERDRRESSGDPRDARAPELAARTLDEARGLRPRPSRPPRSPTARRGRCRSRRLADPSDRQRRNRRCTAAGVRAGSAASPALSSGRAPASRRYRRPRTPRRPVSISNSDDAERPDVGALVHRASLRLFRRHVRRRAENHADACHLRRAS